jgi:hypothetical protein
MIAVRKLTLSVAVLCGWAASLSQAAILPTDLEARVGENFEPADEEENALTLQIAFPLAQPDSSRRPVQRLIEFVLYIVEQQLRNDVALRSSVGFLRVHRDQGLWCLQQVLGHFVGVPAH